jgi:predicted P-loop ATPase
MNMHNVTSAGQTPLEAALHLAAEYGFHVFPLEFKGKQKKGHMAQQYSESGQPWGASNDADMIEIAWGKFPTGQLGIACGPASGVWVVEGDKKDGINGVAWLEQQFREREGGIPETVMQRSPSGSVHYLFSWPAGQGVDIRNSQSEVAPGVDVRGNGGMIAAAPSSRPDGRYEWIQPPGLFELHPAPDWLVEMAVNASGKVKKATTAKDAFPFDAGGDFLGKSPEEYAQLIADLAIDGKKHAAVRTITASLAGQSCNVRFVEGFIRRHCPVFDDNVRDLIQSAFQKFFQPKTFEDLPLVKDHHGRVVPNVANFAQIMQSDEAWKGVLGFNEFAHRLVLHRPIPGQNARHFKPRPLRDNDFTAALCWFNRNGFPRASDKAVTQAVKTAAMENVFNPCTDYLTGIKWDGTKRIDTWLHKYCNAENTTYTTEIGRRWLISAAARALRPGCQVDTVLIMEGAQGVRKSTALRILASEEWFGDSLPDMASVRASTYLRGKWIIELAELTAVKRAEVEQVKAFISRREEDFLENYGRIQGYEPRRCVFAGTTNRDDYLRDPTGGRRFWPVKVDKIDTDALQRDRDQLWAEAVAAFHNGEQWHLSEAASKLAQVQQADRAPDDTWEPVVRTYLEGLPEVSTKMVLEHALGILPSAQEHKDKLRVADLLARLGWVKRGRFTTPEAKGLTRFIPTR